MNKRTFNYCLLMFFVFFLIKTDASHINYQLLEPTTRNFSSRILSGNVIETDEIKNSFDFIPYDEKPIEWDKDDFLKLIERTKSTSDEASEKLGHNRFYTFVFDCKALIDSGSLKNNDQFALYWLLNFVHQEMQNRLAEVDSTVEQESKIPDEQFSFFFDFSHPRSCSDSEQSTASTYHLSSCGSESVGSEHTLITDVEDDVVFAQISLDGRNLHESSLWYYKRKIPGSSSPICISCDLQTIRKDQIRDLQSAIQEIENTQRLREIIFQKGSSIKFNMLFGALKDISEKRSPENPITIIYSTTSDSQKAYKKLSTLQGVVRGLPTFDSDEGISSLKTESIHTCQRIRVDFSNDTLTKFHEIFGE
ncbi:MAG: hypothetical protein HEEMFOPI_01741 [Holosporales bacterium]